MKRIMKNEIGQVKVVKEGFSWTMLFKNQFSKNLGVSAIGLTLCLLGIVLALSFGNLPLTKLLLFCLIVFSVWVYEDDLVKVEDGGEEDEYKKNKSEENIRIEFDKIREQKKEVIKDISEKVLEMTLETKELEAEIEKIKKE